MANRNKVPSRYLPQGKYRNKAQKIFQVYSQPASLENTISFAASRPPFRLNIGPV